MRDLTDYIRYYDGALPVAFCQQLIDGFNQNVDAQRRNGRGVRDGLEKSAWTELNIGRLADQAFLGFFLAQIEQWLQRYNDDVKLHIAVPFRPNTAPLMMKRYRAGQDEAFQPHFDSIDAVAARYMVFLWYLNDVADGGETEFCDLGIKVQARAGRLLMFPPFWMFQHAGLPPRSGDKYILSTYLMF